MTNRRWRGSRWIVQLARIIEIQDNCLAVLRGADPNQSTISWASWASGRPVRAVSAGTKCPRMKREQFTILEIPATARCLLSRDGNLFCSPDRAEYHTIHDPQAVRGRHEVPLGHDSGTEVLELCVGRSAG